MVRIVLCAFGHGVLWTRTAEFEGQQHHRRIWLPHRALPRQRIVECAPSNDLECLALGTNNYVISKMGWNTVN